MVAHLRTATDAERIALCLIALQNDELIGTVNLIENDDGNRTRLRPLLASIGCVRITAAAGLVPSLSAHCWWKRVDCLQRFPALAINNSAVGADA